MRVHRALHRTVLKNETHALPWCTPYTCTFPGWSKYIIFYKRRITNMYIAYVVRVHLLRNTYTRHRVAVYVNTRGIFPVYNPGISTTQIIETTSYCYAL